MDEISHRLGTPVLKEALQWRFERRTQAESYVVTSIKPNKRSEPTMQYTSLL